jgi:hypothetical protein
MERSTFGGIPINITLGEALDKSIPKFRRQAPVSPQPLTSQTNEASMSTSQDESMEADEPIVIIESKDLDSKDYNEENSSIQTPKTIEQTTQAWDVEYEEADEGDDSVFDDTAYIDEPAVAPKYISRFDKFESLKYDKDRDQATSNTRRKVIGGMATVAAIAAASFAAVSLGGNQKNIHSNNTIAAKAVPAKNVAAKTSAHAFHIKSAEHSKTITANVPLTPAMIAANQRAKDAKELRFGKLTASRIKEIDKQDHPLTKTHHKFSARSTPADPITPPAAAPAAPIEKTPATTSTPKGHAAKVKPRVVRPDGGASPIVQHHHAKGTGDSSGGASLN